MGLNHKKTKNIPKSDAYLRAKKKVDAIRGFYVHLCIYLVINSFISYRIFTEGMANGHTFTEIWEYSYFYMPWLIWGFFLAIQAFLTFFKVGAFVKTWEERKIAEYMNQKYDNTKNI